MFVISKLFTQVTALGLLFGLMDFTLAVHAVAAAAVAFQNKWIDKYLLRNKK